MTRRKKATFRQLPILAAMLLALSWTRCGDAPQQDQTPPTDMNSSQTHDPHSFAHPAEAVVKHLNLDIAVDFSGKTIIGTADWTLQTSADAKHLFLDTRDLDIRSVTDAQGNPLEFRIGEKQQYLGQPLEIDLKPGTQQVKVAFATRPEAGALQWLSPEQTAGKQHPFLFTQSQAILARTWLPCQDSPGIRFTYSAKVKVPAELMAVMSASNPTQKSADGQYSFEMKQPIPAYLMALAVGDLVFEPIGDRTGVYAEPATIKAAAYEFADMDKMLVTAEELYGPYAWERYDLIVLPPSFPFGGMENPRLTFATPTILAGDRSLTSLVAHELAHSWSGNLVTNATWNDFWLNEGFTVYFERRIMEKLYGESYAEMLKTLGWQDLQNTLADLAEENPADTKLKLDLAGRDPDDGMTDIAYEKGAFFLTRIEQVVGRQEFDKFLRNYFDKNAFTVETTEGFIQYLNEALIKGDSGIAEQIDANRWIFEEGLPEEAQAPISTRFENVNLVLNSLLNKEPQMNFPTDDWSSHEWLHFIRHIPTDVSTEKLAELDGKFHFTESGNAEIQAAWFEHTIRHNYTPADPALEGFLTRVGRRKFLKPLYKALAETPEGLEKAKKIYAKARPNYHSVSQATLDEMLLGPAQ